MYKILPKSESSGLGPTPETKRSPVFYQVASVSLQASPGLQTPPASFRSCESHSVHLATTQVQPRLPVGMITLLALGLPSASQSQLFHGVPRNSFFLTKPTSSSAL